MVDNFLLTLFLLKLPVFLSIRKMNDVSKSEILKERKPHDFRYRRHKSPLLGKINNGEIRKLEPIIFTATISVLIQLSVT